MIPRKIHYCWFGRGKKPALAQRCIASWREVMPDYEILEWNEDNFDVNANPYTKMCWEQKKYAFLTDYLRLVIVWEQGGIYFDTDVEAVRPFDDLLEYPAFAGFENDRFVNTGEGFGAEPRNPAIRRMLRQYDPLLDGRHGVAGCPGLNTAALLECGLKCGGERQTLEHITVLPEEFLNPRNSITGQLRLTDNTHSIHWYAASWMPWHQQLRAALGKPVRRALERTKKHEK